MATFEQAMLARDRTFAIRVGKYQSNDIKEASFDYGYIKGDTFKPGGTCAGSAKVTFTSIITTFKKLDKVYPEIGLLVGNAYEWVKMGEYFINDIEIDRNRNLTTLDLMDGMFKFNKPFESGLSYPAQIRDVIREICVKAGVTLQTDNFGIRAIQHHIQKKPDKKNITYREVLSQTVQLLGFSAFFNRDGKLEIRGLTESNITITADSYFLHGLTKSEIEYQIAGITCKVKDKDVLTVGLRTGRSLELENSFMKQNILDALYYDLKNLKYYPFNLNYQGHLKLQVGQWVTIKTNKNETFKVPVLNQSFKFQGGLSARISADSKAGNDAQYSYGGFYAKRIEQANTDMAAEVQQQLEYAESEFNKQTEKFRGEVKAGIDKAKNESQAYADRLNQVVTNKVQEVNQLVIANKAEQDKQYKETLAKAGASSDLAKQAQNLATQVRDDLNKVKQTATQAQSQVNSQIEQVKKDVGAIRNQQTAYEQTNTQNLAQITGQLGDKASKAEVKQEAGKIREEISQISIGGRNLIRGTKAMTIASGTWASGTFRASGAGTVKTIDVTDSPATGFNKAIRLTSSDASKQIGIAQDGFDMPSGTYTMSCWIKGKAGQSVRVQVNADLFPSEIRLTKTGWQRVTYTATKSTTGKDSISYVFLVHGAAGDYIDVLAPQLESGTLATANVEALEDADEQITAARTTFERTAEGLKTDMVAVKSYVANDGKRKEELEKYSREETTKQIAAERIKTAENYVGKSQYTEDVKGVNRRFEELRTGTSNLLLNTEFKALADVNNMNGATLKLNQNDYNGHNSIEVTVTGQNKNVWKGITLNASVSAFKKGDTIAVRMPIYIFSDVSINAGLTLVLKKHSKNIAYVFKDLGDLPRNKWHIVEFLHTFDNDTNFEGANFFYLYATQNGHYKIAEPSLTLSNVIPSSWVPAIEDSKSYTNTKLTEYKQDVDGRFATITSQLNNKANQTDFQKVQETTKLYERIIGSTENDVTSKISKMVMSNSLFQVEISKNKGLKTVQSQLAGSWAVQNINSAGDLISGLNLGANGVNRLDGRLTHITGQTLIDNAVIKSAMIDKLKTANFESGSVTTQILASGAVTADKLVVNQAFFEKLSANDAYLRQLFSKDAFITSVQSVTLSASKIVGGVLAATNGAMQINLTNGQIHYYTNQAAMKRILSGYPTQFVKFETGNVNGTTLAGVTVVGSNRYGTESSNDGGFVGIRAWNGNGVDSLDLVGDDISLASSPYENADGWKVTTTGKLQIKPRRQQDRRNSTLEIGDIWLYLQNDGKYYSSLHDILKNIYENLRLLHKHKTTRSDYSYSLRDI